jgi:REP element-mobilizing transposase RayT
MTLPRRVAPGQTVLVTRRTLRRHLLFRPDPELNRLFLYLVAFFAKKFRIELSAIQVLSDHVHTVLTDVHGQLPKFLQELHRVLALCVKVLRKWEGPVWEPCSVSVVELLTAEAEAQQMVYTWLNVVRAGLVHDPREWPGVTTGLDDLEGPAIVAKRPTVFLDEQSDSWPEQVELQVSLPPKLAELGPERARQLLRAELERQLAQARAEVSDKGWQVLGARRCQQVSPYDRATSWEPLRSRNPVLAVGRGLGALLREGIASLRGFRRSYREALERWRRGVHAVLFPYGTWWMVKHHGASMALPQPAG